MTISNSPYEFDEFSRNIFVIFVEKYLSLRKNNNEKDTKLILNKLEPKLKVEKRKITLNYFEKLISNNSNEIENFKQFLKQSGFGEKTSANFHKVLIDNGSSHIINLCNKKEEKGFNVYLDNLCQFADIQYSVKYMDILLNFLSKNFDISSNGKNSDMYNQLINKTQSICFMCNEIKMDPYFNLENHITRIINVLNSENIKLHLDDYVNDIVGISLDKQTKFMPVIQEYQHENNPPSKFMKNKSFNHEKNKSFNHEKNKSFNHNINNKRFFQHLSINETDISNILTYFMYCKKILEINNIDFIIEEIKKKEKFIIFKFNTCDDNIVNKYQNLYKKCKRAVKYMKKAKKNKNKEYKFINEIFNKIIIENVKNHMFYYLSTLNYNLDQFLINQPSKKYFDNNYKLNYSIKYTEYDVYNNVFILLSRLFCNLDKDNVDVSQFILKTVFEFFCYYDDKNKSILKRIYDYDSSVKSFDLGCSFFALVNNLMIKLKTFKEIDCELMVFYKKYTKNYHKHVSCFSRVKTSLTRIQKYISEMKEISGLSNDIRKAVINSDLLRCIGSKKIKCIDDWINIAISIATTEVEEKQKKTENSKKSVKTKTLNNSQSCEKHLQELLYSNIKFEKEEKKLTNLKTSMGFFQEQKEKRDNLQTIINQLILFDEDPSSYIEELELLDTEIEKVRGKFEYYEEKCEEDIAAENSVKINEKLQRYRALLKELEQDKDNNKKEIDEIKNKIDECIENLNYERVHMPTLDRKTGKIQGTNSVSYLPYEEYEYKYIPLSDEGYQLQNLLIAQQKENDKNDRILTQENNFKNLLKQCEKSVNYLIYESNKFLGLFQEINMNNFTKKIVYDIFDKYWFNKKYCIKNKCEMYFRMYVSNYNKQFYKGYPQIVLDIIRILAFIQYVILNEDKIDFEKLINTKNITIDRIHENQNFLGKTFKVKDGDNINKIGIVFKETDTHVIINSEDIFIEEPKENIERITVNEDLLYKVVKPIIGHYKGRHCMLVGVEKDETFIMSVDTYGGSINKYIPGIKYIRHKREEFVILPQIHQFTKDNTSFREYRKKELTFKPEKPDLYTSVRCLYDLFNNRINYFITYNDGHTHDERFNFLYGIALVLYNKTKIADSNQFLFFKKMKNKVRDLEMELKNCGKYEKMNLIRILHQNKKQLNKMIFDYEQKLIFVENDSWNRSKFETKLLNKITEFRCFENTVFEYNDKKKDNVKKSKNKVSKLNINSSEIINETIEQMNKFMFDIDSI